VAVGDAPDRGERRADLANTQAAWPDAEKKSLRAAEQDRPDVAKARAEWRESQPTLDPGRLTFIDETWTKTNMIRLYGWAEVGHRLVDAAPHGHWNTSTFIAGLRQDGLVAPCVFNGAVNGELFLAYVEQVLVPTLTNGDIVIMDNLGSQGRWGPQGDRGHRRQLALPAAIQSGPEPDRAGLRQTQSAAACQGSPNRRGTLERTRRSRTVLLASRMRQLPPSRRIFLVILKML